MNQERSVALYGEDMLECIEKIENYCAGATADEFAVNSFLQDAVFRRLEILGEAAKHVPQAVRARHPNVPWRRIAGLRDVLIHRYPGIIAGQVWDIITNDLPTVKPLLAQVQADLEEAERKDSV